MLSPATLSSLMKPMHLRVPHVKKNLVIVQSKAINFSLLTPPGWLPYEPSQRLPGHLHGGGHFPFTSKKNKNKKKKKKWKPGRLLGDPKRDLSGQFIFCWESLICARWLYTAYSQALPITNPKHWSYSQKPLVVCKWWGVAEQSTIQQNTLAVLCVCGRGVLGYRGNVHVHEK